MSENEIEQMHLASIERVREQASLQITDEERGEIGEYFADLLPLTNFEDDWAEVTLDADMLRGTSRFDELAVYWESEETEPELFGEYRLPNPREILSQGQQSISEGDTTTEREFLRQIRYIDHAWASGTGWTTWIRMAPNSSPLEIWHHDLVMTGGAPYPQGFVKLDLTYREYIQALTLTKGVRGWQYLFADIPFRDSPIEEITEDAVHMLRIFPRLFPENDYADLQRRLEARL